MTRAGDDAAADRAKWNAKYREQPSPGAPSDFLDAIAELLPRSGRALDVAGGTGRHALWLARRGLEVTIADVSDVGLGVAVRAAEHEGLRLTPVEADLERGQPPSGPWDVVVCFYFLHRPLIAAIARELAPGGVLVMAHPTRRNLERHPKPGPAHLLEEGELRALATASGLEVARYEEAWTASGHHEARLVARREADASRRGEARRTQKSD